MMSLVAAVTGAIFGALASLLTTKYIVRKELKVRFVNSRRITLYELCGSFISSLETDSIENISVDIKQYGNINISIKSYQYYNKLAIFLIENKAIFSNLESYDDIIKDCVGILIERPNRSDLYPMLLNKQELIEKLQEEVSKDIL